MPVVSAIDGAKKKRGERKEQKYVASIDGASALITAMRTSVTAQALPLFTASPIPKHHLDRLDRL